MLSRCYIILTVTFGILSNLVKQSFGAYPIAKEYALVFGVYTNLSIQFHNMYQHYFLYTIKADIGIPNEHENANHLLGPDTILI